MERSTEVRDFLEREQKILAGGDWVAGSTGRRFESYNPATGELLSTFPESSSDDVDAAVNAARSAFEPWAALPPSERAKLLWRLADPGEIHADELATTCSTTARHWGMHLQLTCHLRSRSSGTTPDW